MDFYEHRLLSYPDLMLTVLKVAARGEAGLRECGDALRQTFEQAKEQPPDDFDEVLQHLDHAKRNLMRARLLAPVDEERFRITERGRQILDEYPMGVDDTVLMQFPEFRSFVRRSREPVTPASVGPHGYERGYLAFRAGKEPADNPHAFDTAAHLDWENGWFEARDDELEQLRRQRR
jgi:restriction system protein